MTDEQIIKRAKCEIERIERNTTCVDIAVLSGIINLANRQKAEIERTEKELTEYKLRLKMSECTVDEIKSEAIKEFAERLKRTSIGIEIGDDKKFKMTVVSTVAIDNLVEKMTEVEK